MVRITDAGASSTPLSEYVERLGAAYRAAYGADLDLAPETPQGQQIGIEAAIFAELDEAIVAVSNGLSVSAALRSQMVSAVSLLRIEPKDATRSTGTVTIRGAATTVIPSGSRIADSAGTLWRTTAAATIASGGSIDAAIEAVNTGLATAAAGALTQIVDTISGWESVTNAAEASGGRAAETSEEFRRRYAQHTGRLAHGSLAAVETDVRDVDGVTDVLVRDNPTDASVTEQTQAIGSRALFVAVRGGAAADIAQAIAVAKPAGTPTVGDVSTIVNILDAAGNAAATHTIRYTAVTDVPVIVTIPITISDVFPSDGAQQIARGVAAYINALPVADPIDATNILRPIIALQGLSVGTLTIARKVGTDGVTARADIPLSTKLTALESDITVDVS